MSRALLAAGVALSVASLALAGYALQENAALRAEIAAVRRSVPGGAAAGAGAADAADAMESVEERVVRLEALLAGGTSDGAAPSAGPGAPPPPRPGGGAPPPAPPRGPPPRGPRGGPGPGALSPAAAAPLRALVKDLVREEVAAREAEAVKAGEKASPPGERKPPLSQFAAELELEPSQREGVRLAVLKGQEEMIGLLRTPTAGGRVPLDDLLDVLLGKPEEAQPRMIEIFGMLASEPVPGSGSGETYAARIEGVKRDAVEAFRRDFTADQFKAFEKLGQDPLEIQVPDSPWIEILQEAYRRHK